jgi:hypothetical protein
MRRSASLSTALILLCTLILAACGSSSSSGGGEGDVLDETTDTVSPDGADKPDADVGQDESEPPFVPVSIDTIVDPASVTAGDVATVFCQAADADGQQEQVLGALAADPGDGVTLEAGADTHEVTATLAGAVALTCSLELDDGTVLTDDSPGTLQVTAGAPAQVVATLGEDEIPAGGSTTVACELLDAFGNVTTGGATTIDAPDEVTVGASGVTTTVAGEWEIACVAAEADVEQVPATLTVTPLAPIDYELYFSPEKDHYEVGKKATVKARGVDEYGNPAGDVEVTDVSVTPVEGLEDLGNHKYEFTAEGVYVFTGTPAGADGARERLAVVDGSGPLIDVTTPERGATLAGAPEISVSGVVTDAVSAVSGLDLNGLELDVAADGSWTTTLIATHGQNYLVFTATDEWGNERVSRRAFQYSTGYYAYDTPFPEDSLVHEAIVAFLGAALFYDEADPANPATLTAIASTLFADIDLGGFIPNPAVEAQQIVFCAYDVVVENITWGEPELMIKPIDGGLHMYIIIPDFAADFSLHQSGGGICLLDGLAGTVLADSVTLVTTLDIKLDPNKLPVVQMLNTSVDIQNLMIDGDGFGGDVLAILLGVFNDLFTGIIEGVFSNLIEEQVAGLLQDGLRMLVLDETFTFDLPLGEGIPVELQVLTSYDDLSFTPQGGLLGVAGTIRAGQGTERAPLGAIQRDGCLGAEPAVGYQPDKDQPIEAAVYDDLLNEALFAIFWQGVLDLVITAEDLAAMNVDISQYGIADLSVDTQALMAPIIEGCAGARQVQLGDFFIHASFDFQGKPVDLDLYLFVQTAIDIELQEVDGIQKVGITIHPFEVFDAEISRINNEWFNKEGVFENLIGGLLKQVLEDQLADADLAFEIPAIGLGGLVEGLPLDLGLAFLFAEIGYEHGYTTLKGVASLAEVDPEAGGGLNCSASPATGGGALTPSILLLMAAIGLALVARRVRA